jgi:hypothetical protein
MNSNQGLKTWLPNFVYLLTLLSIIITAAWFTFLSAPNQIFGHDYSSYQLLASTAGSNPGAPYLSHFDIKPPFLIYSVAGWMYIFGTSSASLYLLNVIVISGCFIGLQILIKRISNSNLSYLAVILILIMTASTNYFKDMFFTSEALGLTYAIVGLILLTKEGHCKNLRMLFAGLFFGFSLQTKEVYVFIFIVGIGYFVIKDAPIKQRLKSMFVYLSGLLISQLMIILLLVSEGATKSYLEVLRFKEENFPFPSIDILLTTITDVSKSLNSQFYPLLLACIASYVLVLIVTGLDRVFRITNTTKLLFLRTYYLFFLTLLLGFSWQQKPLVSHYAITVFVPFLLVLAGTFFYIVAKFQGAAKREQQVKIYSFALVVIFTFLAASPVRVKAIIEAIQLTGQSGANAAESRAYLEDIKSQIEIYSKEGDCIQISYGWGAATVYNLANRHPCTRYFLDNLIVGESVIRDVQEDIANSPPRIIVYDTAWADLSVPDFERTVIPYLNVIKSCYLPTAVPTVFYLNGDLASSSLCITQEINRMKDG